MAQEGAQVLNEALQQIPSVELIDVLANPLGDMGYLSIIGILERRPTDENGAVNVEAGHNGVENNVNTVCGLRLHTLGSAELRGNLKPVDCRLLAYETAPPSGSLLFQVAKVGSLLTELDLSQIVQKDLETGHNTKILPLGHTSKYIIADCLRARPTALHILRIGMGDQNQIVTLDSQDDEVKLTGTSLRSHDLELLTGWIAHHSNEAVVKNMLLTGTGEGRKKSKLRKVVINKNADIIGKEERDQIYRRDVHLDPWRRFCAALSVSKIRELHCMAIGMGPQAAVILSEIITDGTALSTRLEQLNLVDNRIGDRGRAAIAGALFVEGQTTKATALKLLYVDLEIEGPLMLNADEDEFVLQNRDMRPTDALLVGAWGRTRWSKLRAVDVSENDKMFKMRLSEEYNEDEDAAAAAAEEVNQEDPNQQPDIEPVNPRCFRVTVLQARNLASADGYGQNDDFVVLTVDRLNPVRTSTVANGGVAPVWSGGGGETIVFPELEPGTLPSTIGVEVWDEDPGGDSTNDLIGSTTVRLGADASEEDYGISSAEEDWGKMGWFPIVNAKGKPAGEVLLYLRWDASLLLTGNIPPRGSLALWHLTVDLLECDDLPPMDFRDPNDCYVELSVDGAKERMHRSSTVYGGGASPKWLPDSEKPGERMLFEMMEPPPSIGLVVYDEDKNTKDDLVGDNLIELGSELLGQVWEDTKVVTLTDRKGHDRGTATLKIAWEPAPDMGAHSGILSCTVISCR